MAIPTITSQQLAFTALMNVQSDHNYSSAFSTESPPHFENSPEESLPTVSLPSVIIQKVSNRKRGKYSKIIPSDIAEKLKKAKATVRKYKFR